MMDKLVENIKTARATQEADKMDKPATVKKMLDPIRIQKT